MPRIVKEPKPRVILQTQGQEAPISVRELAVILTWTTDVDLDLLTFYKTQDGRTGGIFSKNYPGGTHGNLYEFPFIELSCDARLDIACKEKEEILAIRELKEMAEIYIVAVNYTDAIADKPSAFIDYDGSIVVINEQWEEVEVPLNSPETGHAAVICKIENPPETGPKLINLNLVVDFKDLMTLIPGANMFVRVKKQ